MNSTAKLVLVILVILLVIAILYTPRRCQKKRRQHPNLHSEINKLESRISHLEDSSTADKWSYTRGGSLYDTLDRPEKIANSIAIQPFGNHFVHHYTGPVGVPVEVELSLATGTGGSCNYVIEEAPLAEAGTGVYTSAAQVMNNSTITTASFEVSTTTVTVTPSLTDSLWMYTCKGGSSTYPLSLRVQEL